jgi:hypothetical protein
MYGIDGAVQKADGTVVIPAAARDRVSQMLTRGREAEVILPQRIAQHQRELGEMRRQVEARHAGVAAFEKLLEGNPDPETFLGRALQFYEQLPALREEMTRAEIAERDRRIAELEGRAPAGAGMPANGQPAAESGPSAQDMVSWIQATTTSGLTAARAEVPEFKNFTDAEMAAFTPQVLEFAASYIRQATERDEQITGIPAGTPVLDGPRFVKALKAVAGDAIRQKQAAKARETVKPKVEAAAQRNAAVLSKPKAPPVPRPSGDMSPAADEKEYGSLDEWKQDFLYQRRRQRAG